MGIENVRAVDRRNANEAWLDERPAPAQQVKAHELDTPGKRKQQRRLLEWYDQEREKQAANRYQMAIDQDFYDNLQYSDEDIAELEERGQAALVYNEVAPTIDWIIGTEKRTRVDFKVLPRNEDDVKGAADKTKVLKYLSDVNKAGFARSLAFADAVKVGVGWIEGGARSDPNDETVFSRYESWRNILWDSACVERDLSDARYLFRIKWVDLDVAEAMFPERVNQLRQAAVAANLWGSEEDEDFWYLGQTYQTRNAAGEVMGRRTYIDDAALVNNRRARVKLIEAWYRVPERCKVCHGEVFDGQRFDPNNPMMVKAAREEAISLYDRLEMRVRCAVMTTGDLLQDVESPYRHNRFPFTPIWCYIRGRDRMPYGATRRIRDPQEDMNKRGSKALFILSTNQVIADHDALDGTGQDWEDLRSEAARPDGMLLKKRGSTLELRRDVQLAEEHLGLMDRDARMIRNAGGVTDENLGRQTNATSGIAIEKRQLQGSVVTAEIFDNLRFSVQLDGEMQLSLAEQYITQPKVIRLVGAKDSIDWLKINQPERMPDGSVRFMNDITAHQADFIVDQQDYHQSVRQAMFESMVDLVGRISAVNPEAGLRILAMALDFSDLPNKDEMADEVRQMLGMDLDDADLNDPELPPEKRAKLEARMQAKQAQAAIQDQTVKQNMAEQNARIEKLLAEGEAARGRAAQAEAQAVAIAQQSQESVALLAQQVEALHQTILTVLKPQS